MSEHNRLLLTGSVSLTDPNGGQIQLRGAGGHIDVNIDRSVLNLAFFSRLPTRGTRRRWLLASQPALRLAGVSVEIRLNGRPVAFYDWKTKGSVLARVLGFGPVDVKLYQLLLAWLRRPPA